MEQPVKIRLKSINVPNTIIDGCYINGIRLHILIRNMMFLFYVIKWKSISIIRKANAHTRSIQITLPIVFLIC